MKDLPEILNWRRVNADITTSGQPTEEQLAEIRDTGVTHIVNLGPHHNKGALEDEARSVASLGMEYIYLPVEFEAPTDHDFERFTEAMKRLTSKRVHVHCIYNARVTAFFYRYAKAGKGLAEAEAFEMMDGIWRPGDDWARFIDSEEAVGKPNRYAGEDY